MAGRCSISLGLERQETELRVQFAIFEITAGSVQCLESKFKYVVDVVEVIGG